MTVALVLWLFAGFLSGWVVNYLADVLPINRKLQKPVCMGCGSAQSIGDYIFLRGCENCGKSRGFRSTFIIVIFTGVGGLLTFFVPERMSSTWAILLLVLCGVIVVIDLEHRLILHIVSLIGAAFGLTLGVILHGWLPTLIGGAAGFAIMLGLYYFGELFRKLMAKLKGHPIDEVALGFGDVNLSGVLGLILGWPGITACLIIAILLGGIVSGIFLFGMYAFKRYTPFTALPYAPFLVAAALFLLFRPS